MSLSRTDSLNILADVLENLRLSSKSEAEALIDGLPKDLHPDASAVVANVWHFVADYDIRNRDDSYRRNQERDLDNLILALRRGDSREELLNFALLG